MNIHDWQLIINQAMINAFLKKISSTIPPGKYVLAGIYLNYQRNGEEYTHSHEGGFQQVICLGPAKRKFVVENVDVAVFGKTKHGLPKDKTCKEEYLLLLSI